MDEKQNTIRPATVELNVPDALKMLISMTKVVIDESCIGQFAPNSVIEAAEILFLGLIEGMREKLKEEEFRSFWVSEFIVETGMYKLTDLERLKEAAEKKKSVIIHPFKKTKH